MSTCQVERHREAAIYLLQTSIREQSETQHLFQDKHREMDTLTRLLQRDVCSAQEKVTGLRR